MDIFITQIPENISVSEELNTTVKLVAQKISELYALTNTEVSITLTDNTYIRELNKKYRDIDKATDVLSFALNESEEPAIIGETKESLGDIIISIERAHEQASEYNHSVKREVAFLTVHGMLHLLGYDHIDDAERAEMEQEQQTILHMLNIER